MLPVVGDSRLEKVVIENSVLVTDDSAEGPPPEEAVAALETGEMLETPDSDIEGIPEVAVRSGAEVDSTTKVVLAAKTVNQEVSVTLNSVTVVTYAEVADNC